ncbi:MAG: hypothetical protein KF778_12560 [Rhodocyclaceae bacterium]|nr:hypothetical protein [Rhodocyclaceae bacterium]
MSPQQVLGHVGALHARIDDLTHQLDWLKRQVFGTKERETPSGRYQRTGGVWASVRGSGCATPQPSRCGR